MPDYLRMPRIFLFGILYKSTYFVYNSESMFIFIYRLVGLHGCLAVQPLFFRLPEIPAALQTVSVKIGGFVNNVKHHA